jgi:hypothetical protein
MRDDRQESIAKQVAGSVRTVSGCSITGYEPSTMPMHGPEQRAMNRNVPVGAGSQFFS